MSKFTAIVIFASLIGFAVLVLVQFSQVNNILSKRCVNEIDMVKTPIIEASPSAIVEIPVSSASAR